MMNTTSSNLGMKRRDDHAVAHLAERTIASTATAMVGIFLLALSSAALVNTGYAGLHLNRPHNLMLIVAGALSLVVAVTGTVHSICRLCLIAGTFFLALGFVGLMFGGAGEHGVAGVYHGADSHLLRIVPGYLELAVRDHLLHVGVGSLYLISAMLGWLGGEYNED
jgi:hypothetical protein